MTQPNRARIRAWVDALKSFKYSQGKSRLYHRPTAESPALYCCLGVACDVAERNGLVLDQDWRDLRVLPNAVAEWFGLPDPNPYMLGHLTSEWNDYFNTTFDGIAALIRAEFLTEGASEGGSEGQEPQS
jgi:hypothetical protein